MSKLADKIDLKQSVLSEFALFEKSLNGASASPVHQVRKQAIASFDKIGFPDKKHEEYKYTNITKAFEKEFDFQSQTSASTLNAKDIEQHLLHLEADRLVFINGILSSELSQITASAEEIIISDFAEAYKNHAALIDKHFGKHADLSDNFTALNTAFANHGAFIEVKANKVIEKPLMLHFISDTTNGKTITQPRNLILLGKNSQVNIIENFITIGENASFTNIVTEIIVEENAFGHYYKIQQESEQAYHVGTTHITQEGQSTFHATTLSLSGAMLRNNLNMVMKRPGSQANMYGLTLLKGKNHVDHHTMVDHKVPHCESNELYKNILDGKSTGVFNGKIFVRQDAQKTNAFQSNKSILLSEEASMNTKPQLEIWADDVKCSHGATIGQLDQEQVFYLQARGLSKETARGMLLQAFAMEVIDHVNIEPLKEYFNKLISERLEQEF
jgi:Fe-S cluster assembly protein SufD